MLTPLSASPESTTTLAARARYLTKVYGAGDTSVTALDGVSLEIPARTFTAVMGPSGSGKSTLMHCMAGLDAASSGEVWIGDAALSGLSDRQLTRVRQARVGFVFQAYNLLPVLTAADNITLPLAIAGRPVDSAWLSDVVAATGLAQLLARRPAEMSGGQQQRVAIARALVSKPSIVFADEPTGNLDSKSGAHVLDLLRRCVREFGQTIVMVTHDPVAASYAGRVVFLADGAVTGFLDRPTPEAVIDSMKRLSGE